jgi:hypothetical protein
MNVDSLHKNDASKSHPSNPENCQSEIIFFSDLSDLPEQVADLFRTAESKSFDLGFDWIKLLIESTFMPQDLLRIYVANDDRSRPQLALSLKSTRDCQMLHALTNFYTSLYAPAVDLPDSTAILTRCLTSIRQEKPAWTALRLQPLNCEAASYLQLKNALYQSGWITFEFFCFGNWYLPVPPSGYSDFIEQLPSRVRHTLARKSRLLSRNGSLSLSIVDGGNKLDAAIQDYARVYAASWKKPEPYPAFVPALIRLCAARGWLRLGLAYIDGEAAAAQLWIVHHGRAAIYKLAYAAKFEKYSIGTILTDHLMRHVMDVDSVKEVDYLVGDDSYKRDWMSHRRERWGLIAYNPRTLAGLGGAAVQFARHQAKRLRDWLRRVRPGSIR